VAGREERGERRRRIRREANSREGERKELG